MNTQLSEAEVREYKDYCLGMIDEYYPLIKKAVSPHAANYSKKELLNLMNTALNENINTGSDEEFNLEQKKEFFSLMVEMHCIAGIESQVRFSSRAFRATLTKDIMLEKCRTCRLDEDQTYEILHGAGYDYPMPLDMLHRRLRQNKSYAASLEKSLSINRSDFERHPNRTYLSKSISFNERDLKRHQEEIEKLEADLASRVRTGLETQ